MMLTLAACGGDDGPTAISKVELGTGVSGSALDGVGTTFKADSPFYAGVTLTNPKATTTVKAVFTAVSTADGSTNKQVVDNTVTTANSETFVNFKFSLPNPWPTGKYKVDILLDGAASQTLNLEIQ